MGSPNETTQEECKRLVDDLWRSMLSFAAQGSPTLGEECIRRFEERELAKAHSMPREQGQRHIDMIDEERGRILNEYTANPETLKRRLNIIGAKKFFSNRFAGAAVTTAVQATIWESIRALFRR